MCTDTDPAGYIQYSLILYEAAGKNIPRLMLSKCRFRYLTWLQTLNRRSNGRCRGHAIFERARTLSEQHWLIALPHQAGLRLFIAFRAGLQRARTDVRSRWSNTYFQMARAKAASQTPLRQTSAEREPCNAILVPIIANPITHKANKSS